jgi:hypothetical protein
MFDFGLTGLNCIYFTLVAIGFMYALIILLSGGLHGVDLGHFDMHVGGDFHVPDLHSGDIHVPDLHAGLDHAPGPGDFDHGDVRVPSLSPITIASFVTAFGAFGIVSTLLLDVPGNWSLLWAALGGLIVGTATHFAYFYLLIKPQGSSEVTTSDIIGATAEVITPIPEGNVGEVAFVAQRGRVTYTAKSVGGQPISKGTIVTVKERVGGVVLVEPKA